MSDYAQLAATLNAAEAEVLALRRRLNDHHGIAVEPAGPGLWRTYCPGCSWAAGERVDRCREPLVAATWPASLTMREKAAAPAAPGDLAHRIREQLRAEHSDCNVQGGTTDCHLGKLWAEDIQEILDAAAPVSEPARVEWGVHWPDGSDRVCGDRMAAESLALYRRAAGARAVQRSVYAPGPWREPT